MSAPLEKTINQLSGKWTLERKLSTGMDEVMALQGLSWLKIKAFSVLSVTESCNQYVDDENITHIDITPVITGGFKGQDSSQIIDGVPRLKEIHELGEILQSSRWSDLSTIKDEFLREGWVYTDGERGESKNLELDATMDKGTCMLKGVWGFLDLGGKRYHARKTICTKNGKTAKCCAVYSWKEDL